MNIYYKFLSMMIVSITLTYYAHSGYLRVVDFDDIRQEGGFKAKTLENVEQIIPKGHPLTEQEKLDLCDSNNFLINLKSLNLSNQEIDDEFIFKLSKSTTLKRLQNIDLSGNKKITLKSIDAILESSFLGSIRDLPRINGHYGAPSSYIYLKAVNTGIPVGVNNLKSFTEHRFDFDIDYLNPLNGEPTQSPTEGGMKFIEIIL